MQPNDVISTRCLGAGENICLAGHKTNVQVLAGAHRRAELLQSHLLSRKLGDLLLKTPVFLESFRHKDFRAFLFHHLRLIVEEG